jgi:hypothetical protein
MSTVIPAEALWVELSGSIIVASSLSEQQNKKEIVGLRSHDECLIFMEIAFVPFCALCFFALL